LRLEVPRSSSFGVKIALSLGQQIRTGYISSAMAFSLVVELLNMRRRKSALR
jgi:hypothetical protein